MKPAASKIGAIVKRVVLNISSENTNGSSDPPPIIKISPLAIKAKPTNNKM